jgi:hypothetical protein
MSLSGTALLAPREIAETTYTAPPTAIPTTIRPPMLPSTLAKITFELEFLLDSFFFANG